MIDDNMIYVYGLLTQVLSLDAGLAMLVNLTHIRSRGAMHRNQTLRERCGSVHVTSY
jgi:hypothetical protein